MEEEWKVINDYPNYMISSKGRIKSLNYHNTGKEKLLNLYKKTGGYLYVCLTKNKKHKWYRVHRLVAEAFIPNPHNLPEVNHKSEIKTQNNVDNLEWCNRKYNHNYGNINKKISNKLTNGKHSKKVFQYDLEGNFIKEWACVREIQRQLGFSNQNISAACLGKYKQSYGYIWSYQSKK